MTFEDVSYVSFTKVVSDFFKAKPTQPLVVRNGVKCALLHYLGAASDWTDQQKYQSLILIDMLCVYALRLEASHNREVT